MIDFINPLYLLFVLAGAIPLLIHLFQRYRARVVGFSSVALLKGAERRTIRWIRLRHLLLLLLRSGIILLIVLSLTHPLLRGVMKGEISTHLPTSIIMIVDNSLSMSRIDEGRSDLARSLDRVRQVLDELHEGDHCALLTVGEPGEAPIFVEGVEKIRTALGKIRPLPIRLELNDLVERASNRLDEMPGSFGEIYVFTDLQESAFSRNREERIGDDEIHLVFFSERGEGVWNRAITSLRLAEIPISPKGVVHLEGGVRVWNESSIHQNVLVRMRLDNGERLLQEVALDGEGKGSFSFPIRNPTGRYVTGFVEIDRDPISLDDRRYFSVQHPGKPRVWLSAAETAASPLRLALRALGDEVGSIELHEGLPGERPSDRDVIVVESPGEKGIDRLRALVTRGLGEASIIIFPPETPNVRDLLNGLLTVLGLPHRYVEMIGSGKGDYVMAAGWSSVTGEVGRFLRDYKESIMAIRFFSHFTLYEGVGGEKKAEVSYFNSNTPWFVVDESENGSRVLFSSGIGRRWGELYRTPLFVPFIDTLLRDVVMRGGLSYLSFRPGERIEVRLPARASSVGVDLVAPGGGRETLYPSGSEWAHRGRREPGNYVLEMSGREVGVFSLNPDERESFPGEISAEELREIFGNLSPEVVRNGEGLEERILLERGGSDLWWGLLYLAMVLLFAEGVLANREIPK